MNSGRTVRRLNKEIFSLKVEKEDLGEKSTNDQHRNPFSASIRGGVPFHLDCSNSCLFFRKDSAVFSVL